MASSGVPSVCNSLSPGRPWSGTTTHPERRQVTSGPTFQLLPTSPFFFERLPMLKFRYGVLTVATIAVAIGPALAQQPAAPPAAAAPQSEAQSTAPAGAYSYFVNLKNGDTVTSPFKVVFGLSPNMGVAPSGVEKANVGHHHRFIGPTL